jgi:hypothetical protein
MLFPERGDDLASYEHDLVDLGDRTLAVLSLNAEGSCVYLDEVTGCTIPERAPADCKAFDCRQWFLGMTRNDRRALERGARKAGGPAKAVIFTEGRKRLSTLTEEQRAAALQRRTQSAGVYVGDEKVL